MPGYIQWQAFKHPDMHCWGFRDDLGFAYISNDRDGWRTKRLVELLNSAEEEAASLNETDEGDG